MSVFQELRRCGAFLELIMREREDIGSFCAELRAHHVETFFHGYRVALLSLAFGYRNAVDERSLSTLACAGLLHDLGKRCVPVDLIDAPRALLDDEREVMSAHPRLGFVLLEGFDDDVRRVVVAHHEYKKDPYPRSGSDRRVSELLPRVKTERRISDSRIDCLSQMVAAADVYDALSSRRSYKAPLSSGDVWAVMLGQFTGDQKYVSQLFADGGA